MGDGWVESVDDYRWLIKFQPSVDDYRWLIKFQPSVDDYRWLIIFQPSVVEVINNSKILDGKWMMETWHKNQ